LQKTADELAGDGVKVAYHHHDFELKSLGDDTGLDRILASSSGERVALELDTYWLWRSGRDPAVFMREVGERCRLLHLKDGLAGGGFTELGSGVLDWHEILGAAADIGGPHLILEQDECSGDRFRSLKMSLKNFEALRQEARS